ncbi:hypothetical protein Btru_035728 [Bulinus truncatus]|nr:hypothetical protein Btru_035728 [Bulinus truncatus]
MPMSPALTPISLSNPDTSCSSSSMDKRTKQLVSALQSQCLRKGCGALKQLSCVFRRMDIDYSKRICFEELAIGCRSYNLNFSQKDLNILFTALDKDRNGQIDFKEFMDLLTPPMSEVRVRVINEAFDKLDVNGDGVIQVDELKGKDEKLGYTEMTAEIKIKRKKET